MKDIALRQKAFNMSTSSPQDCRWICKLCVFSKRALQALFLRFIIIKNCNGWESQDVKLLKLPGTRLWYSSFQGSQIPRLHIVPKLKRFKISRVQNLSFKSLKIQELTGVPNIEFLRLVTLWFHNFDFNVMILQGINSASIQASMA